MISDFELLGCRKIFITLVMMVMIWNARRLGARMPKERQRADVSWLLVVLVFAATSRTVIETLASVSKPFGGFSKVMSVQFE